MLIFGALATHELYMQRCLQLAMSGAGSTAPNPMVGAVLVYNNRIIGEGYHRQYGGPHAEVNCINSVPAADREWIAKGTLYVSLEPCAHYGKTPPCTSLIIAHQIPRVVIGCRDSFIQVNGKGIEILQAAGVEVISGVLEAEARLLNRRFFTFHEKHRPYIILKWAQSCNGKIALDDFTSVKISNSFTKRLVHRWRSEEAGIMVGTNTAVHDNPLLTNRHWYGGNPVRIVLDASLKIPAGHHVLGGHGKAIIFNLIKDAEEGDILYRKLKAGNWPSQIVQHLFGLGIQSVLLEGGTKLLQSFIDEKLWDEARIITNTSMVIENGIQAPALPGCRLVTSGTLFNDQIQYFTPIL